MTEYSAGWWMPRIVAPYPPAEYPTIARPERFAIVR
jgi:hypothetical protein